MAKKRREKTSSVSVALVPTQVHGRYLMRPAAADGAAPLLVAFHGYGQNAEHSLDEVVEIPHLAAWTVVAVQALHPFYNTRTGEVVASWMTKLDRLEAIADNARYVGAVLDKVRDEVEVRTPIVLVGFSQGTAMAYRAALGSGHAVDAVVALGGDVPPELAGAELPHPLAVLIGRGKTDEWYTEEKQEHDVAVLESLGATVETCVFDGGHEWTAGFRSRCSRFLSGRLAAAGSSGG